MLILNQMREIKFRGKRLDNGEWVYGFLIQYENGWFICNFIGDAYQYEVDPSTVGQFTGLKDKNGKEIYGGDILRREGCWNVRIEFEKGVFWVRDANKVRYNNKILNTPIASFQIETFEVIGNVWQNPELLEGVN